MQTQRDRPPQDRRQNRLAHVYWLGGSPCSGKSSVADWLAARYDLHVYHIDEAAGTRLGPYDAQAQPCMHRWTAGLASGAVTWDDLWMRPPDELLAEVFACYQEQFDLVVADLLRMERRPVIVEGNPLLPERVWPLLTDPSHALWMVACESFQRRIYPQRGPWVQDILSQCRAPEAAMQNWMDRDVRFAEHVSAGAEMRGGALIRVDGACSLEETACAAAQRLGLEPVQGAEPE